MRVLLPPDSTTIHHEDWEDHKGHKEDFTQCVLFSFVVFVTFHIFLMIA
jgi:hypothetical protein